MGKLFSYFEAALAEKKAAFAIYRKPGENIVRGIFGYEDADYSFGTDTAGFVFAPFNEGAKVFIPSESATVLAEAFEVGKPLDNAVIEPEIDLKAKADFEHLVEKSIAAISTGQFDKLVCSRTENVMIEETDAVALFKRILKTYPNAFCYCFYSPESGLWLGATPEQLIKVKDKTLQTVALAGTQVYNEEATWPEKEKLEQQFVTDYIVSKLKSYATVEVSEPYTFRAGNLAHIKTDISVRLENTEKIQDVIEALHPTPAVCGLPKDEAAKFLFQQEGYGREYYSGFLGEMNMGKGGDETDVFVNLRCMKIEGNAAKIFVGCGITKDSNPEKEFFETVNKSITMRRVL